MPKYLLTEKKVDIMLITIPITIKATANRDTKTVFSSENIIKNYFTIR